MKIPRPGGITFLPTLRCNASCKNCCFGCRPARGHSMPASDMKQCIDVAKKAFGYLSQLQFTGGECMLRYEDILDVAHYAHSKYSLRSGFLSNCFWATSREAAREKLKKLYDAGMRVMTVSTGDDHQEWVSLRQCMDAAIEAANLYYSSVHMRVELHDRQSKSFEILDSDEEFNSLVKSGEIKVDPITWQNFNNEEITERSKWKQGGHIKPAPCDSLLRDIIIMPQGDMMACCGINCSRIPFMRLGNVYDSPMDKLWADGFKDALKIWLIVEGPRGILKYISEHTAIPFPYSDDRCEICQNLFSDKMVLPYLKATYHDWYHRVMNLYMRRKDL